MKRILPIILFFVGIACVYWSQNNLYKKLGINPEDYGGLTKKEENDFDILIKDKKEFKPEIKSLLTEKNGKLRIDLSVKNTTKQDLKKVNVYLRIKQKEKLLFGKSYSLKLLKKEKLNTRKFIFKNSKKFKGAASLSILVVSDNFFKKVSEKIDL